MNTPRHQRRALITLAIASAFISQAQAASTNDLPAGYVAQDRAAELAAAPGATTLLLQDVYPWDDYAANEYVLDELGVPYVKAGSASMARLSLARYSVIIVASAQTQPFYDALKRLMPKINRWLLSGRRTLQFHGSERYGWGKWSLRLPLGVSGNHGYEYRNYVIKPARPIVAGLPRVITDEDGYGFASNVSFNLGRVPRDQVTITTPSGQPTLLSYCYGRGRIFASGLPVEIAYSEAWDARLLLPNMTRLSTSKPGC